VGGLFVFWGGFFFLVCLGGAFFLFSGGFFLTLWVGRFPRLLDCYLKKYTGERKTGGREKLLSVELLQVN